jgi:hypothetical protein
MTGSGKTGLCISLIEEAAIDGIPAIVIDPKGDLSNLLLTFPNLSPGDFEPWVNPDDARQRGISVAELAASQAAKWKEGLAAWGQDGGRIARLRQAADFAIYTPGSTAGIPLSVLASFKAPDAAFAADPERMRDRIQSTATSLLALVGVDGDPINSREHILLATVLQSAWTRGRDLTLAELIQQIQSPPVTRVGVLDLDAFFPPADRFRLATAFNNLLASPGFDVWMQGEPLDIGRLLYTPTGTPRVAICSIAHLGDAERMFFVSLLLNLIVGWMRGQPGTTSLRAIVYMDEIAGYFPPVANPPSKAPFLTLLKQGRAFGVGTVLATQNPVDLDYKGLANAGTWLLGRLQTERDMARVLDGLEGASSATGRPFDRRLMEQTLAGLASRTFVMNNVHEQGPVVFETRWAMSYLRGPLERQDIRKLMESRPPAAAVPAAPTTTAVSSPPASSPATGNTALATQPPVLPAGVTQFFVPARVAPGTGVTYRPAVFGSAQVRYVETKLKLDASESLTLLAPIAAGPIPVDWSTAAPANIDAADLDATPAPDSRFASLPPNVVTAKSVDAWTRALQSWIYSTRTLDLFQARPAGAVSAPGESERDFRLRLQQSTREARDQMVEQLRRKYAPKIATAQDRLRRAQQAVDRESEQTKAQSLQTAISFGTTLLGALMGRKTLSASTLGRATTAARGVGRTMKESQDVGRAKETVEAVQQQIADLEAQLQQETGAAMAGSAADTLPVETISCKPKKGNITVRLVALVWVPYTSERADAAPAW